MTEMLLGGCACRKIRYECKEKPIVQLICHCRDCQRASGSAFAALMIVPADRLTFTGAEMKHYAVEAASGRVLRRLFCADCGSPVSLSWPNYPHVQFLQVASLDDPSSFTPTAELWVSRAYEWHSFLPSTVKFQEGPSEEVVRKPIAAYFAARHT